MVLPAVSDGYALRLPTDAVDVWRFRGLVVTAREARHNGDQQRVWQLTSEALALWAHPVADLPSIDGHTAVGTLRAKRWTVAGWHIESALALGRAVEVVSLCEEATAEQPLDELWHARLIRVYHACGRRADAFEAHRAVRRRLIDDLGVDPGPEIEAAHRTLLDEPAATALSSPGGAATVPVQQIRTVPAQLPAAHGHFTGRTAERAALDRVCTASPSHERIAMVTGPAGIGKTALVVEWAHDVADGFVDGQLFIDVRGYDEDEGLSASAAVSQALRGLGLPADRIPRDPADQVNAYRTMLSGKRVLVVLDNATSSAQVVPLVPPSRSSLMVVICRKPLLGLAVRHAVEKVTLDLMPPDDALQLLRRCIGAQRVDAEREATAELIARCNRLPFVLRLAAARLIGQPRLSIASLIDELDCDHGRLDALDLEDSSTSVRALLTSSYQTLSAPAAHTLGLLAHVPGPTVSARLVAFLAELSPAEGRSVVEELTSTYLMTEVHPERYAMHDLTRSYVVERAVESRPDTDAVVARRLLRWYLRLAEPVNRITSPQRTLTASSSVGEPSPGVSDARSVMLLDAERDNMSAVVRFAAAHRQYTAAWQLAFELFGYFLRRGHSQDSISIFETGLAAARQLGDRWAEAQMCNDLGVACYATHRLDDAMTYLDDAVKISDSIGDAGIATGALCVLGLALGQLGRYTEALEAVGRAHALATGSGDRIRIGMTLNNLGAVHRQSGHSGRAMEFYRQALENREETGHVYGRLITLGGIGGAYHDLGNYGEALVHLDRALVLSRQLGDRRQQAIVLHNIARTHLASGELTAAADRCRQALAAYGETNDRHGEAVALTSLASALIRLQDLPGASASLERAAALRSRIPDPHEEKRLNGIAADLAAAYGAQDRTP